MTEIEKVAAEKANKVPTMCTLTLWLLVIVHYAMNKCGNLCNAPSQLIWAMQHECSKSNMEIARNYEEGDDFALVYEDGNCLLLVRQSTNIWTYYDEAKEESVADMYKVEMVDILAEERGEDIKRDEKEQANKMKKGRLMNEMKIAEKFERK